MSVQKKIRFLIISPGLMRKICEVNRIPGLEYTITTEEYGVTLNLVSAEREIIKAFVNSLPADLFFFHVPSAEGSAADFASSALKEKGIRLSVVESCTGGLIGKMITDRAGSSAWFWGGFITYENSAKSLLGVPASVLENFGAVSRETVLSMAEKGLESSGAGICVAVSGIAGPDGGSFEKPVGTVWIGVKKESSRAYRFLFSGTRTEIREKAAQAALLAVYKELLNIAGVDSNIFEYYI